MIDEKMKEEINKLDSITTYDDTILAGEIANIKGLNHIEKDWKVFCLLGQLYRYGKMQGIREERAKKKKRNEVI